MKRASPTRPADQPALYKDQRLRCLGKSNFNDCKISFFGQRVGGNSKLFFISFSVSGQNLMTPAACISFPKLILFGTNFESSSICVQSVFPRLGSGFINFERGLINCVDLMNYLNFGQANQNSSLGPLEDSKWRPDPVLIVFG